MALLIDGELHDTDQIRNHVETILKADCKIQAGGFSSHEFDVVDVGAHIVTEAVLVVLLVDDVSYHWRKYEQSTYKSIYVVWVNGRAALGRSQLNPSFHNRLDIITLDIDPILARPPIKFGSRVTILEVPSIGTPVLSGASGKVANDLHGLLEVRDRCCVSVEEVDIDGSNIFGLDLGCCDGGGSVEDDIGVAASGKRSHGSRRESQGMGKGEGSTAGQSKRSGKIHCLL